MAQKRKLKVSAEDVLKLLIDTNKRYKENLEKLEKKIKEIEEKQSSRNKEMIKIANELRNEFINLKEFLNFIITELERTRDIRRGDDKKAVFQCGVLVFDGNKESREEEVERFKEELMQLMKRYGIGAVNASFIADTTRL